MRFAYGLAKIFIFIMFSFLYEAESDDDGPNPLVSGSDTDSDGDERAAAPKARGRAKGSSLSTLHKEKIRAAAISRHKRQLGEDLDAVVSIVRPSVENHISKTVFAGLASQDHRTIIGEDGELVNTILTHRGLRSEDNKTSGKRGAASYVTAQANAVSDFVANREGSEVMHAFSQNVFDDASMWMRDMAAVERNKENPESNGRAGRLQTGSNMHKPCCNVVETLFVRRREKVVRGGVEQNVSTLRCARIKSPCQPLPSKANAAAVGDRVFAWSVLTARGSGSKVDPEKKINFTTVPLTGTLYTKDNLLLNDCIIGMEEKLLQARQGDPWADARFIGSFECMGHSAVLGAKSAISNRSILPKMLVKLGHLLESARTSELLLNGCLEIFRKRFRYRKCVRLPAECAAYRKEHAQILKVCRPCRAECKTILEEEKEFLDAGNGSWDTWYIDHWCVIDACPLGCNGDPAKSRRICEVIVFRFIRPPMTVALEYRWKGMENANTKVYLTRRFHDIWHVALIEIYPQKVVNESIVELERLEALLANVRQEGGEAPARDTEKVAKLKKSIRGGAVVNFVSQDQGGHLMEKYAILSFPFQHFLNATLKVGKETQELMDLLQQIPADIRHVADGVEAKVEEGRNKVLKDNLDLLLGAKARNLCKELWNLFTTFTDEDLWHHSRLAMQERFEVCCDACVVLSDNWYRLVFPAGDPKRKIFEVCRLSLGPDPVAAADIRSFAIPYKQKRDQCKQCVDPHFTMFFTTRLLDPDDTKVCDALELLGDSACFAAATSVSCEKKHLIGQGCRGRRRGRCLDPASLSTVSLVKELAI